METLDTIEAWAAPILPDREEEFKEQVEVADKAEWELSKEGEAMKNLMKKEKAIRKLNDEVTDVQHRLREVREHHIISLRPRNNEGSSRSLKSQTSRISATVMARKTGMGHQGRNNESTKQLIPERGKDQPRSQQPAGVGLSELQ